MSLKIDSIKNILILTQKNLCWTQKSAIFSKTDFNAGVPTFFLWKKVSRIAPNFLKNTSGGCFCQSCNNTVKSAVVQVLWFCASTCFQFSSNYTKYQTSVSFLLCGKTISFLLGFIGHVLQILEYVLEKHLLVSILMKKLRESIVQITI